VAALESAEAGDISLFSDSKYANAFAVTKASVVITSDKLAKLPHGVTLLVVPNPRLAFAQVGHIFYPPAKLQPGVRRTEPVHPTAKVGEGTEIGPAGERVGGYPARPLKRWHRETALLAKMAKPKKTDEQEQE
jgi:UDP-3-O-[3-hydroxymyristoyl] glucosamine N-acyltransferase